MVLAICGGHIMMNLRMPHAVAATFAVVLAGVWLVNAQDEHLGHSVNGAFGTVHFEISCSPAAQQQFDHALAMLHSFFYPETEKAFRAIAEREPSCALALLEAVDLADKTYSKQLKAAGILERLQKTQPEHPGIVHYLIHSYDYAPIAAKGLPAARRYAALAPSAPHALHMPSHIFSTLGMWPDAIRSNLAADAANRAYAVSTSPSAAANPAAIVARYHNLDFLTNAYLQLAQDRRARAVLDERNSIGALPPGAGMTSQTGFAAIAVRYAFERGSWKEAAMLPPMNTPVKQADAIVWFGRALGAARSGDIPGSKQNLSQISRLQKEL